ncbi:hypothetical protein CAL29_29780 [Bordetella genomosp. 10]|uniref:Uncharacterized protein n=1 Tax=Bordetella genomosp. 10 TaxID=1416804 RepID=A0A261S3V7_9BORD|nr:hypothetical protein CAL29_29780 [Bordetella genomosp. 10]
MADFMVPAAAQDATTTEPGSTADSAPMPRLIAWGLGVRDEGSLSPEAQARIEVSAVRGPISASELKLGMNVPIGDPGLLMPALYSPRRNEHAASRTICIPHFHDRRTDAAILAASQCDLVLRASIPNDLHEIERFIDSLTSADFVLCGSLHAAILAVAYGVPFAYWDSGNIDLPIKWKDFSASIGIDAPFAATLDEGRKIWSGQIEGHIQLPPLGKLLASAPYIIRPDALLKVARHILARHTDQPACMAQLSAMIDAFGEKAEHFQQIADEATESDHHLRLLTTAYEAKMAELQQSLIAAEQAATEARKALADSEAAVADLESRHTQQIRELNLQLEDIHRQLGHENQRAQLGQELSSRLDLLRGKLGEKAAHAQLVQEVTAHLEQLQRELDNKAGLDAYAQDMQRRLHDLQHLYDATVGSLSWRVTAPLRNFLSRHPGAWRRMKRFVSILKAPSRLGAARRKAIIKQSCLFDADWYLESNADVRESRQNPLDHYVAYGAAEGRSPRRLFDVQYYLGQTRDRHAASRNPLLHYIKRGRRAGLAYSPIFAELSNLAFSEESNPVVSIIIPTYGQVDFTAQCLLSIYQSKPKVSFEIIVAEDASGDPDVQRLRAVKNINLIERKQNLGFLRSCNDAARVARGEYIFLLNNDTQVLPDALDELVAVFAAWPEKVGMAGARLLYPGGMLQEAGGLIWKDGAGDNFGKFDDANKHQFSYHRRADYISGAAIMIPKPLWEQLEGFDEHYLPAYCEDSDLAFRIRQAGHEVVYVSTASVVHFEGISHGRDLTQGIKAYQVENTKRLRERWKEVFLSEQAAHGDRSIRARDRAMHRKVTLVIDHYVPEPDKDAGSRTMTAFIEQLVASGRVVKFWPDNRHRSPYTTRFARMGVEVIYGPWIPSFEEWIQANGGDIDEVLLSRPQISVRYIDELNRHTRARLVYYGHDLHHARMAMEAQVNNDAAKAEEAEEMRELEMSVWKKVDVTLYPSQDEIDEVRRLAPDIHSRVVSPYAFDVDTAQPLSLKGRRNIVFVAGFSHPPNVAAAIWFCEKVFPLVRARLGDIKLSLVGSNPTQQVQGLATRNIEVTGFVSDAELTKRYSGARMAVAPLHYGAGVKLKVVEALKEGVPLVTTTVGAQGLHGVEAVCDVMDGPEAFAEAVIRLLRDDALWAERSAAQRKYVLEHFSKHRMTGDLEAAFAGMV